MSDNDDLLASLTGFTPGPWGTDKRGEVHKCRRPIFSWPKWAGQTNSEEVYSNMRLGAAAPDLHRIATEQAAEIKRLRDALSKSEPAIADVVTLSPSWRDHVPSDQRGGLLEDLDDGSAVFLSMYSGGGSKKGVWNQLELMQIGADGKTRFREYSAHEEWKDQIK
jgi:hypothetical protein